MTFDFRSGVIIIWKDIKGWEDLYEVNENGEVRKKTTGQLIKGDKNSEGYCRVRLEKKNHKPEKQRFFRHRLVADHFLPNPNNLKEVNHKDCNIENNHVNNLEWVDKKANELHSRMYGSKEYKPFKVVFDNNRIQFYNARKDLSDELGITRAAVKFWLHGKNNGYLNYNIKSIEYV